MNTAALPPPVPLCPIPPRRLLVLRSASKRQMEVSGIDSNGREFSSASEMWREEIGGTGTEAAGSDQTKLRDWYSKGISYWQGVEASVEGVLGGYGCVNDTDVKESEAFLKMLLPLRFGKEKRHLVALDCGAGIGRVSKNLLLRHFNEVDLVEPVSHFLETARENLSPSNIMQEDDTNKATNFYCVPLQDFTPEPGRYDVIWVQWCIGHLPDEDFISFFNRAKAGLKTNGFFILKENTTRGGGFVLDKDDQSITRSDTYFRELFERCGLYVHSARDQKELPKELFPVKMYCLVTEKPRKGVNTARKRKHGNRPAIIKS
ncbi:Alpha N-terminal protein methyltransferase 1 [Rhynchospora pubera]|uniref:Alpha N-terminal protein methyltransferase 1 n=1 Tax=Rhynchospora pubera TaxID=906938 RepID=A0AAV8BUS6_9POAL|nr:Alpha N-terminal protein methyltransferase 1 [Rhynchospora pubera]